MRRRISIRGCVRPSVRQSVTPSLRRVLGGSYAVFPALFFIISPLLYSIISPHYRHGGYLSYLHVFSKRAHFSELFVRPDVVHENDIVDEFDQRITHFVLASTAAVTNQRESKALWAETV